ncbi:sulfatase [Pelagicoccus sp. SDUM812005]|uniref:sulfatase family protein n=1 Tax=Pelagicoccus sp. SDUM812005 TaxID=3041257 RepID=UPI00280FED86|nr:sulfatase [Pelagicoccus sp. SDUM812005]MDQ8183146.1 sulfatase [Pelagicoccus sp. SDUM812005]
MHHLTKKVLAAFTLTALATVSAANDRPNIVMILSDDQAWTDYGFMGHEHIRTPNLDKLAESGVLYPRAYVPTPLCRPSLMTLATGHYARDHKITGNDPSPRLAPKQDPKHVELSIELFDNIDRLDTLPKLLGEAGYLSHQSGKWWEGHYSRGGFTHGMTQGSPGRGARHGDAGLKIGRQGMDPIFDFIAHAQEEEKPFYIWYAPFLPHTPHTPPERILARYSALDLDPDLAKYYAMCEWFDETCGQLIDHLEEKGLRESTLIYYVCDNGWVQTPSTVKGKDGWRHGFLPKSKQSVNEGGARSPIILSWPGVIEPDIKGDLVSSIDLFPTVLSAADVEIPDGLPGIDLMPNARDGDRIDRDTIFGDSYAHDIADLDNPEASLMYLWCIRDHWKLILSYDGEVNRYRDVHPREFPIQLYDIVADPHEENNLAEKYPNIVADLKDAIENWYPLTERKLVSKN